jgi:hypothetical protein
MKRALSITAGLVALAGCTEVEKICTDDARASLVVSVEDSLGPVEGLTVEYAVDGGDFEACGDDGGGDYICGMELSGLFEVRIDAEGYELFEGELEVLMDEDGCHPAMETMLVTLLEEQA